MIQDSFERFVRLEAVGLFDSQFRFVVHPFDTAVRNGSTSVEPIQPYLARGEDALLISQQDPTRPFHLAVAST